MSCQYCYDIITGDNYTPIITSEQDFGFFGSIETDVYITTYTERNGNEIPIMILGLCANESDGNFSKNKHINFCPMCGTDLHKLIKEREENDYGV